MDLKLKKEFRNQTGKDVFDWNEKGDVVYTGEYVEWLEEKIEKLQTESLGVGAIIVPGVPDEGSDNADEEEDIVGEEEWHGDVGPKSEDEIVVDKMIMELEKETNQIHSLLYLKAKWESVFMDFLIEKGLVGEYMDQFNSKAKKQVYYSNINMFWENNHPKNWVSELFDLGDCKWSKLNNEWILVFYIKSHNGLD